MRRAAALRFPLTMEGSGRGESRFTSLHPPIAPSGLYWVVDVPADGLTVSADGHRIMLEMEDVPVIDQPRWPALDAAGTPARMNCVPAVVAALRTRLAGVVVINRNLSVARGGLWW